MMLEQPLIVDNLDRMDKLLHLKREREGEREGGKRKMGGRGREKERGREHSPKHLLCWVALSMKTLADMMFPNCINRW